MQLLGMSVRFHYNSNGYFPDRIETERLTLERVSKEKFSAEEVFEVMSSQGVEEAFETYPYETPDNLEEAQEYVEKREYENREDENSMYFVKLDDSEDPFIGLEAIKNKGEGVAEIGFWISSDYWGNGYSPEASEAMLDLLLDEKDFDKVEVQTRKSNQKAQRAIEKFIEPYGGEKVGEIETTLAEATEYSDSDEEITEVTYEIKREAYQSS